MRVGSLFAGIGGFDLGFERAGFKTVWQVEIDEYCRKVLARHFPDAERFGDIRECCGKNHVEWDARFNEEFRTPCNRRFHLSRVDVLCGGFPCQDVSEVGARAGIDGIQSGLWAEMRRIIDELRPQMVVVENVSGLFNRGIGRVLGELAELRYGAEWACLSACQFGAPHTRERVFIVAYADRRGQETSRQGGDEECSPMAAGWPLRKYVHQTPFPGGGFVRPSWSREPRLPRMDDGIPNRVDRNRSLGNAVVPQIAQWIAERIKQVISNDGAEPDTSKVTDSEHIQEPDVE